MNAWIVLKDPLCILPEPNDGAERNTTDNRPMSRFTSTYFRMEKQDLIKASGGAEVHLTHVHGCIRVSHKGIEIKEESNRLVSGRP